MAENGDGPALAPPPAAAWAIQLANSVAHYTRRPDGGMILHLTPLEPLEDGKGVAVAPRIDVLFSAEGWRRFRATVEADGVPPPLVEVASELPLPPLPVTPDRD